LTWASELNAIESHGSRTTRKKSWQATTRPSTTISKGINQITKRAPIGRRIILPATYTGGPRYYEGYYEDAMAMVAKFGAPDLFITVTCIPTWPEIQEAIRHELPDGSIIQQRTSSIADQSIFGWI